MLVERKILVESVKLAAKLSARAGKKFVVRDKTVLIVEKGESGRLDVVASDLDVFYRGRMEAFGVSEAFGPLEVDSKLLLAMVSRYESDMVKIDWNGTELSIDGHVIPSTVAEWKRYDMEIKCHVIGNGFLARHTCLEWLPWVSLATDQDSTRYQLGGVLFDLDENAIVATDGRRLHLASLASSASAIIRDDKGDSPIVPLSACKFITEVSKASKKDCSITFFFEGYRAEFGPHTLEGRTVIGRFPSWKQVMPDSKTRVVSYRLCEDDLERLAFARADLKKVAKKDRDDSQAMAILTTRYGNHSGFARFDVFGHGDFALLASEPRKIFETFPTQTMLGIEYLYQAVEGEDCWDLEIYLEPGDEDNSRPVVVSLGSRKAVIMPMGRQGKNSKNDLVSRRLLQASATCVPSEDIKQAVVELESVGCEW